MVGVTLPQSFKIPKGFGVYEVPAGEYAIFRFKGLYHELNRYIVIFILIGYLQMIIACENHLLLRLISIHPKKLRFRN